MRGPGCSEFEGGWGKISSVAPHPTPHHTHTHTHFQKWNIPEHTFLILLKKRIKVEFRLWMRGQNLGSLRGAKSLHIHFLTWNIPKYIPHPPMRVFD